MDPQVLLFALIFIFSIIQSIFGVGLLVFGTPSLLLLGYSFDTTLSLLLPCSLAISFCQIFNSYSEIKKFRFQFIKYALPSMAITLVLTLLAENSLNLRAAVGLMLIFSATSRLSAAINKYLQQFIIRHANTFLVALGLVHGATNMGGGLLTIYANSTCENRQSIRAHIAYGYALMALIQILLLAILGKFSLAVTNIYLVLISLVTYLLIGNRIFLIANNVVYYRMMTALMFVFGFALIFL
jgi:hypothetical protein